MNVLIPILVLLLGVGCVQTEQNYKDVLSNPNKQLLCKLEFEIKMENSSIPMLSMPINMDISWNLERSKATLESWVPIPVKIEILVDKNDRFEMYRLTNVMDREKIEEGTLSELAAVDNEMYTMINSISYLNIRSMIEQSKNLEDLTNTLTKNLRALLEPMFSESNVKIVFKKSSCAVTNN